MSDLAILLAALAVLLGLVMALVTIAMTGPLLNRLRRPSEVARHG